MSAFDHDPSTCSREHCGRCRPKGEANPPQPVDHDVAPKRKPSSRRELDLGRHTQAMGRRIEDEGHAAVTHFAAWEREAKLEQDSTRGGGLGGGEGADRVREQRTIREVSNYRKRWLNCTVRLDAVLAEMAWLLDQARAESRSLEKHRTPAQVEAEGFCGNCWRHAGELIPVTERPSGEPYYRGRCRFCGSWPGGDPPAEVVKAKLAGRSVRVKVS